MDIDPELFVIMATRLFVAALTGGALVWLRHRGGPGGGPFVWGAALAILLSGGSGAAAGGLADIPRDQVVYVQADPGAAVESDRILTVLDRSERVPGLDIPELGITAYRTAGRVAAIPHALHSLPGVRRAWRDAIYAVTWTGGPETPQDEPFWSRQWNLNAAYIPDVWGIATGDGVTVAVIDTGVDCAHADANCSQVAPHYDALTRQQVASPTDPYGHGTHVAGIIAAPANSRGIIGGAPDARILSCRACNANGRCAETDVTACVVWATRYASVLNMSLGGSQTIQTPALCEALTLAQDAGVMAVASVGNNGPSSLKLYPASCPGVIGVAASIPPQGTKLATYSQRASVDITAPGSEVLSSVPGGAWAYQSGTSMAAPHVSAAGAILREAMGDRWTVAEATRLLQDNAYPICGPVYAANLCGHGALDVNAAVRAFMPQPPVPTEVATATDGPSPTASDTPSASLVTDTPAAPATSTHVPAVQTAIALLTAAAISPTPSPTVTRRPLPTDTDLPTRPPGTPTASRTPTAPPTAPPTLDPVALTVTALWPTATLSVEGTLTALAPTPDRVGTAVAATLGAPGAATRRAAGRRVVYLPLMLSWPQEAVPTPTPPCLQSGTWGCAWATEYARRTEVAAVTLTMAAAPEPTATWAWPLGLPRTQPTD